MICLVAGSQTFSQDICHDLKQEEETRVLIAAAPREFRNALGSRRLHPPGARPATLCRNSSLPCLTIDGTKSLLPQRWKRTPLQHVLGVPLCQKWTGRHRAVSLVMGRGPGRGLFQREGEGGSCFQLTVSFSSFLALTTFILRASIVSTAVFCCRALCFMFSSAASLVFFLLLLLSSLFLTSVLYRVDSFALIT